MRMGMGMGTGQEPARAARLATIVTAPLIIGGVIVAPQVRAYLGIPQEQDLESVFCSELVAGAYQEMGALPAIPAANHYLPGDFVSTKKRSRLKLNEGANLSLLLLFYTWHAA